MIGVGEAIRIIMKKKGLRQKNIALSCGLSTNSIVSIEKGRCLPTQKNLSLICNSMNISMAYLMLHTITEDDFEDEHKILFKTLLIPLRESLKE